MANLKIPSLQHLARNWWEDPTKVKRALLNLAKNSPTFNYEPLYGAVRDMLVFGQPYEQIVKGLHRGVRRPDVLENYLGVVPLIDDYFDGVTTTFVQAVDRRYYPVSQKLLVPFHPPVIYGAGGHVYFPWFSFWRANPIVGERLSLFVTLVEEVLLQDPDLEEAKFNILDFSAPQPGQQRELNVIDTREVERVSAKRKSHMLAIFAQGYSLAEKELDNMAQPSSTEKRDGDTDDDDQPRLFPPDS